MSELQLTNHGIKRLKSMREEVLRGDYKPQVGCLKHDGAPLYFSIDLPSGHVCAFVSEESDIENAVLKSIDATFSNPIKMNLFSNLDFGRFACAETADGESVSLDREDYSTPAQRALESLRSRLEEMKCQH